MDCLLCVEKNDDVGGCMLLMSRKCGRSVVEEASDVDMRAAGSVWSGLICWNVVQSADGGAWLTAKAGAGWDATGTDQLAAVVNGRTSIQLQKLQGRSSDVD